MLNTVFAFDDKLKIERFSKFFTNDKDSIFAFFNKSSDIVEFLRCNNADIFVLSVSMDIMDGQELAEMAYDTNPKTRFIFAYREDDIEKAINLFNYYENCRIVSINNCEPDNIKRIIDETIISIKDDELYKLKSVEFRERERAYKKKMAEMSTILNSRVECYREMVKLLSVTIDCLFDDCKNDYLKDVISFFENELNEFIRLFLDRTIDINTCFQAAVDKYSSTEDRRFFSFNKDYDESNYELNMKIIFCMQLICDAYLKYMNAYRAKVDIGMENNFVKMDVIYDLRAGNTNIMALEYISEIIKNMLNVFSDKSVNAYKDGIIQFRLYFNVKSQKEEIA